MISGTIQSPCRCRRRSKNNRCHHESDRGVPACSRHDARRGPHLDPRPPPRRLLVGFSNAEGRQESCSQVNLKGHGWSGGGPEHSMRYRITSIACPRLSPSCRTPAESRVSLCCFSFFFPLHLALLPIATDQPCLSTPASCPNLSSIDPI